MEAGLKIGDRTQQPTTLGIDDMTQTRAKQHHSEKIPAQTQFERLSDSIQDLVWLYLIFSKTDGMVGLNTEKVNGARAEHENNPGAAEQLNYYCRILGIDKSEQDRKLPAEFDTRHKFRSKAQAACLVASKYIKEGMLFVF